MKITKVFKNSNSKLIRNALLFLLAAQFLMVGWFVGMGISSNKMAVWIEKTQTEPFLANGSITVTPHNKKLTTQPLHVEYSILKVVPVKTTAAKK